jgi:uncharacterized protein HemY
MLNTHQDTDEALTVLSKYFDSDATDQQADLMLAGLQARTSVPAAIATLRRASEAAPDKPYLQTAMADYMVRNHQESDAAAVIRALLAKGTDDANLLNSAAYVLAQSKSDLPLAEEKSRKSLEILASQTEREEIGEVNSAAFQRSSLSAAGWDTLGFILFRENKLQDARDYLAAAWHNRPDREVTLHYGELQEALGDRKEAMRIYSMTMPPSPSALAVYAAPASDEIKSRIERLEKTGVPNPNLNVTAALQQERTFKLKLPAANAYWSATYRLLLDSSGTREALKLVETTPRQGVVEAIKQLALPQLVPHDFKGRIVRDGIISCSVGKTECEFVLMPMGGMAAERVTQ